MERLIIFVFMEMDGKMEKQWGKMLYKISMSSSPWFASRNPRPLCLNGLFLVPLKMKYLQYLQSQSPKRHLTEVWSMKLLSNCHTKHYYNFILKSWQWEIDNLFRFYYLQFLQSLNKLHCSFTSCVAQKYRHGESVNGDIKRQNSVNQFVIRDSLGG